MKDSSKTHQDLIAEISVLKKRIQELEQTLSEMIQQENERCARQLTVLHETSIELTAELGLDALLHSIAKHALNLIGGAACNCYLYNPQTDLLERVASAGTPLVPSPKARHRGEGMVGQVWVTGTPLLVNDYASWPGRTRAYDSFPSRALVAAPFRLGTETLGVLNIMALLPHQYTQIDVEMLSLFAAQAAIAIRNARLYDQMKMELAERKRVEEALRESEQKYRQLVENANSIILRWGRNGKITFMNEFGLQYFGYTAEEIIGRHVVGTIVPENESTGRDLRPLMDRITANPKDFEQNINENMRCNGERVWISWTNKAVLDGEGQVLEVLSIGSDITQRKRAEEALKESELKYNELAHSLPQIVFETDIEGNLIFVNRAAYSMAGYSPEEFKKGLNVLQMLVPEDRDRARSNIQRLLHGEGLQGNEYTFLRKDGHTFPIITETIPIVRDNQTLGLRGVIIDITERKLAEQETAILADIGRLIASTLNIDEVYERVASEAQKLVLFDNMMVNLIRVGENAMSITYASGIDIPGRRQGDRIPYERSLAEMVVRDKKGIVLQSESAEDIVRKFPHLSNVIQAGLISTISVPLISKDEVIGVLVFRSKKQDAYTEKDLRLAERIGIQIAGAIANAHLYSACLQGEKQLQQTLESLRKAVGTTIQVLASVAEARDPYTAGHQIRSADLARTIAIEMGLPQDKVDGIRIAGSIHDIGKISVPAEILSKPTKLSEIEFALIKAHSQKGYEMLKDVESPWPLAEIVYQHHERIDGSGYPRNLKGEEICIEARILAVADTVEAMASHRPYRPGLGIDAALNEIEKNSGIFYDTAVADACLRLFREKGFQLAKA